MNKIVNIFKHQERLVEAAIVPHFPTLYSQAYKYTSNRATAQDLVQDVFVYALENRSKILQLDPVLPWLMRCLYHRFIDHIRKHKTDFLPPDDKILENLTAPDASAEDQYFHEEVKHGLQALTAEQKVAVTLFDIEGYSLYEVCAVMDLPLNTVKSHLHRGRRRLKEHLQLTGTELSQPDDYPALGSNLNSRNGDDSHEL